MSRLLVRVVHNHRNQATAGGHGCAEQARQECARHTPGHLLPWAELLHFDVAPFDPLGRLSDADGNEMDSKTALRFVQRHGIVLEAAQGPVVTFADAVAGERIRGGWWGHPKGRQIFALTRAIRRSPDVLVCRLVDDKITYVHRRLWAALVRLASEFDKGRLAAIEEIHTRQGKHIVRARAFPKWVPASVAKASARLSAAAARVTLGL